MNRGIESFFRECFDGLHGMREAKITLYKGRGLEMTDEHRVWCLPRTGAIARFIGTCVRRDGYVVEQLSSMLPIIRRIRADKPDLIFYSDNNLAMRLWAYRRHIGVPFRMLYSNGAPLDPPFTQTDHVQQLAPFYMQQALDAGEPAKKHSLVPYGITVPAGPPQADPLIKAAIRRRLRLPVDRQIILSVGWISAEHKRMDYLINEISRLDENRPYLVMLGSMNANTPPIIALAREKLGELNFCARSVSYEQVAEFYQAADLFVLCSLKEGFGRVYLESLMHGLPTIANDHPVMRYVLGDEGIFADLSREGALTHELANVLKVPSSPDMMVRRRESVRSRFSWPVLVPQYLQMFRHAAGQELR